MRIAMAACGPSEVQFETALTKDTSLVSASPNRAIVYVFGNGVTSHILAQATVRVGMDGSWVGAVKWTPTLQFRSDRGYITFAFNGKEETVRTGWLSMFCM